VGPPPGARRSSIDSSTGTSRHADHRRCELRDRDGHRRGRVRRFDVFRDRHHTVRSPILGAQATGSGSAITPARHRRHRLVPGATLAFSATGLPAGLSIDVMSAPSPAPPRPPATARHGDGDRRSRRFGQCALLLDDPQHGDGGDPVTSPNLTGRPSAPPQLRHRHLVDGHADVSATGWPPGCPSTAPRDRLRHSDHGLHVLGHADRHRHSGPRAPRRSPGRSPTPSRRHPGRPVPMCPGRPSAPCTIPPPTPRRGHTDWSATGLPAGLSIDSSTGTVSARRPRPARARHADRHRWTRGPSGSTSFTGRSPTTSRRRPRRPSDASGSAVSALTNSATDSSSTGVDRLVVGPPGFPGLSIDTSSARSRPADHGRRLRRDPDAPIGRLHRDPDVRLDITNACR